MKIKTCGIQTKESSQLCNDLSIDFIGLNFVSSSKRFMGLKLPELKKCNNIANLFLKLKVGIFMNQEIDIILKVLKYVELDIIQLHGRESPEFTEALKNKLEDKKYKNIEIWKAFSINDDFKIDILQQYCKFVDLFLFDGNSAGSGSKIKNQKVLQKALKFSEENNIKYGIAGGIKEQNISTFKKKFPKSFLLDTASGIEKNGIFNEEVLKKLVQNFKDTGQ